MKKTFAILFASTALTAGIGLPAWSAMHGIQFEGSRDAGLTVSTEAGASPVLVSDDDEDHDRDHRRKKRHGDYDDHDDDDDDDDSYGRSASPLAPAGSAAPPNNGLFGSSKSPKVQVN